MGLINTESVKCTNSGNFNSIEQISKEAVSVNEH